MMERRLWREGSLGIAGKVWQTNWLYVLLIMALAAVGYIALYAAAGGSPEPYAQKQLVRFGIGFVIMVVLAMTDIRRIATWSWPLYALGILLLLVVARYGHVGKGAQRWIDIGGLQLQPSELMKISRLLRTVPAPAVFVLPSVVISWPVSILRARTFWIMSSIPRSVAQPLVTAREV